MWWGLVKHAPPPIRGSNVQCVLELNGGEGVRRCVESEFWHNSDSTGALPGLPLVSCFQPGPASCVQDFHFSCT